MQNDFVHAELTCADPKAAAAFYKKVFAWKIAPFPGMDYLGVNTGSKTTGGGIQKPPMPQAPTAWMPYVQVADVKKSLAKAQKAGATIVQPHTPVGGMGAIGIFVDPQGAALGVWQASPPPKKKPAKKKK